MNLMKLMTMKKANSILMMAALFLTGALSVGCSEVDDNEASNPNPTADRVYTVTGTVHFGGDGSTRSSLTEADGKLKKSFKVDEEMAFVYPQSVGGYATAKATFTNVTADGATFTVQLVNPATGNVHYHYPYSAYTTSGLNLTALYNNQKGTKADIEANWDCCTAYDVAITVDGSDVTLADATLHNDNILLDIESVFDATEPYADITNTITKLTILVKTDYGDSFYTISPSGTTFTEPIWVALLPESGVKSISVTAYTNDNKYYAKTLTGIDLGYAHFHKASKLTLTAPQLGDLFYSDGTYSTTLADGKTPIGVIAYLGNDVYTEKNTNMGTDQSPEIFNGHGLVLALKNASSNVKWSTDDEHTVYTGNAYVTDLSGLTRSTGVSGYLPTKTMATATNAQSVYPAAYAAWNYTPAAPNGTTGWFLPSAQQWVRMMTGLGELSDADITWSAYFDNSHTAVDKWEAAMAKAGTAGTDYDRMNTGSWTYWSSSEGDYYSAVYLYTRVPDNANDENRSLCFIANNKALQNAVRPVFAF